MISRWTRSSIWKRNSTGARRNTAAITRCCRCSRPPVLRPANLNDLNTFTREMRRYIRAARPAGGGTLLAYSPEVSVLLFNTVPARTAPARRCFQRAARIQRPLRFADPAHRHQAGTGLRRGHACAGIAALRARLRPRPPRQPGRLAQRRQYAADGREQLIRNGRKNSPSCPCRWISTASTCTASSPACWKQESLNYDNEALMSFLRGVSDNRHRHAEVRHGARWKRWNWTDEEAIRLERRRDAAACSRLTIRSRAATSRSRSGSPPPIPPTAWT